MQVFFVISGYFSFMLYQRYDRCYWLKVRLGRVVIPLLSAIPLITLPQLFLLKNYTQKLQDWHLFTIYQKINIAIWEVISHLWFLLTLALLTGICFYWFKKIKNNASTNSFFVNKINNIGKVSLLLLLYVLGYSMIRKMLFILNREILFNSVFNFFSWKHYFIYLFLFSVLTALFIHKLNRYLLYFHLALFWHHYCYFSLTTQTNTLILLIFFPLNWM
ncbi:osmoregulated periplasmic glucan biosynthetic protein [Yersinia pseudotuberculosis]|uniref:Osmoregulated periplasmic glucan biosynthetic protein n=2 Tax=Yersinia pseudotuberculosis TaxID=633 RepID=A0A380QAU8_YERPU|nr:osmoregulated periplasmic glucan biosynthetic protein [Yersinia pseudotuberculosis]